MKYYLGLILLIAVVLFHNFGWILRSSHIDEVTIRPAGCNDDACSYKGTLRKDRFSTQFRIITKDRVVVMTREAFISSSMNHPLP